MDWDWVEQFADSNPLIVAVIVGYALAHFKDVRNFIYVVLGKMPKGSIPVCKQDFKDLEKKVDAMNEKLIEIDVHVQAWKGEQER